MTVTAVTALETAAIPTAIGALNAVKQFNANMGTDPAKWVINFPAAQLVLMGSLQLLVPSLLQSEGGAVITEANSKIDGWITVLQSKVSPAAS